MAKKDVQQVAAFAFGVTFVVAMLIIAMFFPKPTVFQVFVFRVVLALAAAGVAAMVPGFLNVKLGKQIRAGGAIAVFIVVYFLNPASLVAEVDAGEVPAGNPREVAENYLATIDELKYEQAWSLLSQTAQDRFSKNEAFEAYKNVRTPLGGLIKRELQGLQSAIGYPGWPVAHFRAFNYQTTFERLKIGNEQVVIMSENDTWRVAMHMIYAR